MIPRARRLGLLQDGGSAGAACCAPTRWQAGGPGRQGHSHQGLGSRERARLVCGGWVVAGQGAPRARHAAPLQGGGGRPGRQGRSHQGRGGQRRSLRAWRLGLLQDGASATCWRPCRLGRSLQGEGSRTEGGVSAAAVFRMGFLAWSQPECEGRAGFGGEPLRVHASQQALLRRGGLAMTIGNQASRRSAPCPQSWGVLSSQSQTEIGLRAGAVADVGRQGLLRSGGFA